MGGVWFHTTPDEFSTPMLWRFGHLGQSRQSTIYISDLELSVIMIAIKDVLATYHPVAEHTIWMARARPCSGPTIKALPP